MSGAKTQLAKVPCMFHRTATGLPQTSESAWHFGEGLLKDWLCGAVSFAWLSYFPHVTLKHPLTNSACSNNLYNFLPIVKKRTNQTKKRGWPRLAIFIPLPSSSEKKKSQPTKKNPPRKKIKIPTDPRPTHLRSGIQKVAHKFPTPELSKGSSEAWMNWGSSTAQNPTPHEFQKKKCEKSPTGGNLP